jgi:hypothetical protein
MPAATPRHDGFKRLAATSCEAALHAWAAAALGPADRPLVRDGQAWRAIPGAEVPGVRLVARSAPEAGRVLAPAGGQDHSGTGGDGRGARAGPTGGGGERGAAPAAAGASARARAARPRGGARRPQGALPADPPGGRGLPVHAPGPPAASARRPPAALRRPAARRALPERAPRGPPRRAAGGAAPAGLWDAGRLPAGGGRARRGSGAGGGSDGARAPAAGPSAAPRGALAVRSLLTRRPVATRPTAAREAIRRHGSRAHRRQWPRDMPLGADACQVRSGQAPQALAAGRTAVSALRHQHQVANRAAALRANAWAGAAAVLTFRGLKLCMTLNCLERNIDMQRPPSHLQRSAVKQYTTCRGGTVALSAEQTLHRAGAHRPRATCRTVGKARIM